MEDPVTGFEKQNAQIKFGALQGEAPTPVFFVSVASKEVSFSVSPLFATHTEGCISVADKGVRRGAVCL